MARNRLILNRYAPLAEAGVGGFGTVQVAWDTRIQRKVAIKCIELDELKGAAPPETFGSRETISLGGLGDSQADGGDLLDEAHGGRRDDFSAAVHTYLHVPGLDEARTAALLNDANIVAVYDFEVQGSTAYLIMEYVEGFNLAQLLSSHGDTLTLDAVAAVFSGVAHALEVAHENQVLHLDIKPDNILIDRKGQVKVTDFGLAKLAGAGGYGSAAGGTIGYMPLEQMRGESLDARCDEWALASVAYEMLTGENPFLAGDLSQAEAAIEDAELVLPSLCWDDLDEQVDDVLFYALDPDRDERYDTVADFAEEMEKFLGDARRGRRQLAELADDGRSGGKGAADDPAPRQPRERSPLGDRIGGLPRKIAERLVAALGSALVMAVGLSNLPGASGADNPLFWGILVAVCASGAVLPHMGALLAYAVLSAALIAQGAPAVGCALAAATGAWWWFVGRDGVASANVVLTAPLVGAVGAGALAPLAAGATLRPVRALATAAFSALVALILACLGSKSLFGWEVLSGWGFAEADVQGAMASLLAMPGTWAVVAGWVASAAALSVLCLRGSRTLVVVGAVIASALLIVAACVGAMTAPNAAARTPSPEAIASILASAAAVAAVALSFPSYDEEPLLDEEGPLSEER